jgi:hypothetical protein
VTDMVYDEDYTGPRFTYGLTYRLAGYAQVPDDRIVFGDRKDTRFRYGTIQYPRRLSDREVESFELTFVGESHVRPEPQVVATAQRVAAEEQAVVAARNSTRTPRTKKRTREWVQIEGRVQKFGYPWDVRYDSAGDGQREHARIWTDGFDSVTWSARKGSGDAEDFADGSVAFDDAADPTEALKTAIREARRRVIAWLEG